MDEKDLAEALPDLICRRCGCGLRLCSERSHERIDELEAERADMLTAMKEIDRRFRAVAIHTRDDRDYDLTYLAGAIQDARAIAAKAEGEA